MSGNGSDSDDAVKEDWSDERLYVPPGAPIGLFERTKTGGLS